MKTVRGLSENELINMRVWQREDSACWFACCLMYRNIITGKIRVENEYYEKEKENLKDLQIYNDYAAVMSAVYDRDFDPFLEGAGADFLCNYLNKLAGGDFEYVFQPLAEKLSMCIKDCIDNSAPVIMALRDSHFVVIVGYDEDDVAFLDPLGRASGMMIKKTALSNFTKIYEIIYKV